MLARMHVFVSISTSFQTDYSDSLDFACVKCQCPHPWVCIAWVLPAVTIPKCDEWVGQKNYSSGQRRSNGQLWEPVLYLNVTVGLERSGFKIQVYEDAMLLLKTLNTFYHHNIDQLIFSFLWPECLTKTMEGKKDSAWLTVWGETTDLAGQAPGRSMRQAVMLPPAFRKHSRTSWCPSLLLLFAQPGACHWGGSFLFSYTFLETIPERHVRKCFHGDCKSP